MNKITELSNELRKSVLESMTQPKSALCEYYIVTLTQDELLGDDIVESLYINANPETRDIHDELTMMALSFLITFKEEGIWIPPKDSESWLENFSPELARILDNSDLVLHGSFNKCHTLVNINVKYINYRGRTYDVPDKVLKIFGNQSRKEVEEFLIKEYNEQRN